MNETLIMGDFAPPPKKEEEEADVALICQAISIRYRIRDGPSDVFRPIPASPFVVIITISEPTCELLP